jgi:hypothetical protein
MGNNTNEAISQVGQTALPSRDAVTQHQIGMLQSIISTMGPYAWTRAVPAAGEPDEFPRLDPGVALSASLTFINACTRLDTIIEDSARWETAIHDRLYDSIEKVQLAQVNVLKEQAESAKAIRRPCYQFKPILARTPDTFIAYYGGLPDVGVPIMGTGATLEEALANFDLAFAERIDTGIPGATDPKISTTETPLPTTPRVTRKKNKPE